MCIYLMHLYFAHYYESPFKRITFSVQLVSDQLNTGTNEEIQSETIPQSTEKIRISCKM